MTAREIGEQRFAAVRGVWEKIIQVRCPKVQNQLLEDIF